MENIPRSMNRIAVMSKQGAVCETDSQFSQFQLACEPEIESKTFNSKFMSISSGESSLWKDPAISTQRRTRRTNNSTKDTLQNNFSTEYHRPNYYSDSRARQSLYNDDYRQASNTTVSFYPVVQKGYNYLKYCTGWLLEYEKPSNMRDCVLKYTSESGWYCTEINFALASDSSNLKKYGSYIKQLKYSIGMSPAYVGTVYRGMNMSPQELAAYESQDLFFIPSFTSTSKTRPYDKNTLIHIDITPEWSKFCMEIQSFHTKYTDEEEVLLSCYNLYRYERTEKSNGKRMIKLRLMDYDRYFDYQTNTITQ